MTLKPTTVTRLTLQSIAEQIARQAHAGRQE